MKFQRGDDVLVNYPFASGVGTKVRPALVIQNDLNNRQLDNTIVIQITSRVHLARTEPTQVLIEVATDAGRQSGLLKDSAISCENLYTVRQDAVVRKLGSLPVETLTKVSDSLKVSLQIE